MTQGRAVPFGERPAVLSVRNMLKVREKGGVRFALQVPALSVYAGEFLAIVGESGCGKSTLLDMLGLVLRPDSAAEFSLSLPSSSGSATAGKEDAGQEKTLLFGQSETVLAQLRKREIGYVLQSGGLLSYLSVLDNILLPCHLNKISIDTARRHAVHLAEILGISSHLNKKPAHLSGGQRQRVAIARALVHQPRLVLADEPTAAVDKLTAREIRDAFRKIARDQGVALVMVTHDRDLIRDCADTIVSFELDKRGTNTVATLVPLQNGTTAGGAGHD